MNDNRELLVEVKNLKTYFYLDEGTVRAVDGADFGSTRGETWGWWVKAAAGRASRRVQSSASCPSRGRRWRGKSCITAGRRAGRETLDLTQMPPQGDEMRSIRGAEIAMVFQEPMTRSVRYIPLATRSRKRSGCTRV